MTPSVTAKPRRRRRSATKPGEVEHCTEALAVLHGLDVELAQNAKRLGRPLKWSTADVTIRAMIADAIDRKVDLHRRWQACDDDHLALKFSAEVRQLEKTVTSLLLRVKTDMPTAPTLKSAKATKAARTRWDRNA